MLRGGERRDRARLTLGDLVYLFGAFAFFGVVFPVFRSYLDSNAASLGRGDQLLFLAVVPLMLMVTLYLVYSKGAGGA